MEFKRKYLKKKKKVNFKKKYKKEGECCICFQNCILYSDNIIQCGKKMNVCCSDCKYEMIKSKIFNCPLCRSHQIKQPIYKNTFIKINLKDKKTCELPILSPKMSRGSRRKKFYDETFGPNTNRLVRQRKRMYGNNIIASLETRWFNDNRVFEYNRFFNYDSDDTESTLSIYNRFFNYDSDDTDTESTLSIVTDVDYIEYENYQFETWDEVPPHITPRHLVEAEEQ
jgi:hypothetical protein